MRVLEAEPRSYVELLMALTAEPSLMPVQEVLCLLPSQSTLTASPPPLAT